MLLLGMLDAVYLYLAQSKGIVAVSPKPVFRALFESVESREQVKLRCTVRVLEARASASARTHPKLVWRARRVLRGTLPQVRR